MMNISWIKPGVLAASPLPRRDADLQSLYDQGIRAILTLTERSLTANTQISDKLVRELGITLKHIPIDDFHAPTYEQAEEAVAFIDEMAAVGRPVLVHCLAGQGRTGCILHSYFLTKGSGLRDAKYEVSMRRPICDFGGLSLDQQEFIQQFAQGRTVNL
jgi:atypical dual specificity phosphatase